MSDEHEWKHANAEAITSLTSSVTSATATGFPDVAKSGTNLVINVTNNFYAHSNPEGVTENNILEVGSSAAEFEATATDAGVPNTYIFQLREDRDKALERANSFGQKADVWIHYVGGLGKTVNDWAAIPNPFKGGENDEDG